MRELIGRRRGELPTPALLLDIERARANASTLAARLAPGVAVRPHAKIHKCAELAELQLASGASGITVATVDEALAFAGRGISDILIANEVVGAERLRALAALASSCRLCVAVDDPRQVSSLEEACAEAGSRVEVMIDVDLGLGRCGVRSPREALELAGSVAACGALGLRGVIGYEGHAMTIVDPGRRAAVAFEAYEVLARAVDAVRGAGHEVAVVSAGGTTTYELAAEHGVVTEVRPGSYLMIDGWTAAIVTEFQRASTVLASVISRHGTAIVVDCGVKAIDAREQLPALIGHQARPRFASEEHLAYDLAPDCRLDVGDTVELAPWECGPTINLHRRHHVIERDAVVDLWDVLARDRWCSG